MTRTHLALVGLLCIVTVTSGCASLGLPSGPLAETDHAHGEGGLDVSVGGHVESGEEATVVVTHHGDPVANASVYRAGDGREFVGRTGDDGRLAVAVPADDNLTLVVESGDLSGRYPPADEGGHDGEHAETDHHDDEHAETDHHDDEHAETDHHDGEHTETDHHEG